MGRARSAYEKMINAYKMLVRKPAAKRLVGRPRCRWKNNSTDVTETA